MKILNPRSALLSDFEVLLLLKEMEDEQQSRGHPAAEASTSASTSAHLEANLAKVPENLRSVQYATMSTLCHPSRACLYQSAEHIGNFHSALRKAGFIGGRRGVASAAAAAEPTPIALDDDDGDYEEGGSSSQSKKRRSAQLDASRKRTKRESDVDDPLMTRSPPSSAIARDGGPDEILPDRALTKAERLMLVNQVPRNVVELHTLVEELEMRFNDAQIHELLAIVHAHLPLPLTEDEALAGGGEQGEEHHDEGMESAAAAVDWDTLQPTAASAAAPAPADASMSGVNHNGLFMGGNDEDDDGVEEQDEDDDEWVNDHTGRGGGAGDGDDLEGPGGDDD